MSDVLNDAAQRIAPDTRGGGTCPRPGGAGRGQSGPAVRKDMRAESALGTQPGALRPTFFLGGTA